MFNKLLTDWSSPLDQQRNDLVFENRNKEYGAYVIRRDHDKTLIYAFITASAILTGLLYATMLFSTTPVVKNFVDNAVISTDFIDVTPDKKPDKILDPNITHAVTPDPPIQPKQPDVNRGTPIENLQLVEHPVISSQPIFTEGHADPNANPTNTNTNVISIPTEPPVLAGGGGGSNTNSIEAPILNSDALDVMPTPVGGDEALTKFIIKNVNYPKDALELDKSGSVFVQFVIEKDGSVSTVSLMRGVYSSLDREAMRVVRILPKWNPGMSGGKPARVYFRIPIKFQIKDNG